MTQWSQLGVVTSHANPAAVLALAWADLDIAGTAMSSRRTSLSGKGATGFGVRLLDAWLKQLEP